MDELLAADMAEGFRHLGIKATAKTCNGGWEHRSRDNDTPR